MIERLPTPWGLVRLGRRARPPEHQGGLAGLREDGREARLPLPRQRRGRSRRLPRGARRPLRRRGLRVRRADRPADGDPRRGPARLVARHCVRRLVQRPPRLPGRARSTSRGSAPSWSGTGTSRSTSRACSRSTAEEIRPTDTADAAIDAILAAGIEEILVLGRRGPVQAAFTNPELVELTELAGADLIVDPADLVLDPASEAALEGDAMAERNLAVLREVAAGTPERQAAVGAPALPHLAGRAARRRTGRGGRGRAQPARGGPRREDLGGRDGRARDDPLRHRPAQRRLPRRRASTAFRSTSAVA